MTAVKSAMHDLWKHYPSYTSDMWSASDGSQYLGLQLHVINDAWDYYKFSTGAVVLPPPHDQWRIAAAVDQ